MGGVVCFMIWMVEAHQAKTAQKPTFKQGLNKIKFI